MLPASIVASSCVALTLLCGSSELRGQARSPEDRPQLRFAGEAVEIAMPAKGGRSIVQVRVGGEGPYDFLIDTGAGVSVIDSQIAAALSLEVTGSLPVGAPGGGTVDANQVSLPALQVGDLEIEGAAAVVLDIAQMTGGVIQGVLGMDLFGDVLLTLDPASSRAVVSRGELTPDGPGVVQADTAGGRMRFPIDVAGQTVLAQIDTGSPAGLTLGVELLESTPTLDEPERQASAGLVGGSRAIRLRTLDGVLRFAGLEYENPQVGFMDPSPGTANIGSGILNELVTTVDLRNGRLAFRRADPNRRSMGEDPTRTGPRRLGVRFRGTPGGGFSHVADVDPGSLGERAGFQPGDVLLSVNGRPLSEYDQASLGRLIRGSESMRWEIERDGERLVIEIP